MAIFAANRYLQISLEIQCRSLLVCSLAKKAYHSSGPVRYIPKNYTVFTDPQKAPALESCEKKEGILLGNKHSEGKRGASKLPKFHDNDGQNSLFRSENFEANSNNIFELAEELPDLDDTNCSTLELIDTDVGDTSELIADGVLNSLEDSISEKDDLLSRDVRQDAEKLAIELLAARAYTELELRKKLRGKKYPPNIVEGLLNDGLYAESFSRSRWLSSTWGPRRIKHALVRKGVKEEEVDKATKQVFEGEDGGGDGQMMPHGMSKAAMDRLFVHASKQWRRGQNTSPENRKARVVRWLQYRGFSWGVTNAILRNLVAQYPP